jgi:hypothetical protein
MQRLDVDIRSLNLLRASDPGALYNQLTPSPPSATSTSRFMPRSNAAICRRIALASGV